MSTTARLLLAAPLLVHLPAQATCGDPVWESAFEECDDGNTESGDGCSADCLIEEGYRCTSWLDLNTGGDGIGGPAEVGSADAIWGWSDTLRGDTTPATVAGSCAPGVWAPEPFHARWVNRYGCAQSSPEDAVTYYSTRFRLVSSTGASRTRLVGRIWGDASADEIYLNYHLTGVPTTLSGSSGDGIDLAEVDSSFYLLGVNVLTVAVYNAEGANNNPDGLLVSTPAQDGPPSRCELLPVDPPPDTGLCTDTACETGDSGAIIDVSPPGCGCAATGASSPLGLLLLLTLGALRRAHPTSPIREYQR